MLERDYEGPILGGEVCSECKKWRYPLTLGTCPVDIDVEYCTEHGMDTWSHYVYAKSLPDKVIKCLHHVVVDGVIDDSPKVLRRRVC